LVLPTICGLVLLGQPAIAEDPPWQPPEPSPESKDWIRMSSLEWLRGELHLLRDDKLEFESEELDDLKLDWDDVVEFRSPRILTYAFEDSGVIVGTALMRDSIIVIQTEEGPRTLPRTLLLSIIEGRPTEWNYWSAKLNLGMITRSGNTNQADLNTIVLIRRQSTRTRLDLNYTGNFSEVNDEQTVNNHLGSLTTNFLVTKGFFITPLGGGVFSDKFQNIELRWSLGAGLGYFLIRRSGLDWYVQLGGGYQETRFVSVEAGQDLKESSGTVLPATEIEMDITKTLDFTFKYNSQITMPYNKGTIHHTFALLSYELTSLLDFDISANWDRVENPKATDEGFVPNKDDFRISFGLGVDI
jgi:hypothetical protein